MIRMFSKKLFIVSLSCILFTSCAKDIVDLTGNISGTVKDYSGGQFIENCKVSLSPGGKSTTTASNGLFEFNDLQPGDYTLSFSKAGYYDESTTISVVVGQTSNVSAMLKAKAPFALSETLLDFGDLETSKIFYAFNNSDSDCSFTIKNSPNWLHLSQESGTVKAGSSESISATVDRNSVGYGNYSQTLNISYSGKVSGSVSLVVKFAKVQLTAPKVAIADKAENITQNSFDIKGEIEATGGSPITNYGHCWSTSENPTIDDNKTALGSTTTTGEFTSNVAQLATYTTYYVRAYATNDQGTTYSKQISVTTQDVASDKWDGTIATSFAGGSGTFVNPYIIKTGGQLLLAKDYSDKYFELGGNIDLDNKNWLPFKFKGTLDGKGYQISNLYINRTGNYQGLFSECFGSISNLTIRGVKITAESYDYVGSFSGAGGNFTNCTVVFISESSIKGNSDVGGICGNGEVSYGTGHRSFFSSCSSQSSTGQVVILGNENIGGIIGYTEQTTLKKCNSSLLIKGSSSIGGLIGCSNTNYGDVEVSECSFRGTLLGNKFIGGIIGKTKGGSGQMHGCHILKGCKTEVEITSFNSFVGGLIGVVSDYSEVNIYGSYSAGKISGDGLSAGFCNGADEFQTYKHHINVHHSYSTILSQGTAFDGFVSKYSATEMSINDCATTASTKCSCNNCQQSCLNITNFMQECYSQYANYWNFNKSWIWEGSIGGNLVKVKCPYLSWE